MRQRESGVATRDLAIEHCREMLQILGRGVDRRDVRDLVRRAPRQNRTPSGSRLRTTATTWPRRRGAAGSPLRGFAPVRRPRSAASRPMAGAGCPRENRIRQATYRKDGSSVRAATSPGFTSCGISWMRTRAASPSVVSTHASAQFVVPRSMPTTKRSDTRITG